MRAITTNPGACNVDTSCEWSRDERRTPVIDAQKADEGGAEDVARLQRQLAAMRLLMNSERSPSTHDVLLATAFEALASGPKTLDEILNYSKRVWPGAVII